MKRLFCLLLAVLLLLSACSSSPSPSTGESGIGEVSSIIPDIAGDGAVTLNNMSNGSRFVAHEGWLYLLEGTSDSVEDYLLYRQRPDGSEKLLLLSGVCGYLNVTGGWVYFTAFEEGVYASGNLCRIPVEGGPVQVLVEGNCSWPNVVGDWIYFILEDGAAVGVDSRNPVICKVRTDGSQLQAIPEFECKIGSLGKGVDATLTDYMVHSLQVQDGYLYFATYRYNSDYNIQGIYRLIPGESRAEQVVCGERTTYFNILDDLYIFRTGGGSCSYTIPGEFEITMYKSPNGNNVGAQCINTADGWIFTGGVSETFRLRPDGTGYEMICNQGADEIYIYDGWLYFNERRDRHGPGQWFRMRPDGSELELLPGQPDE